MTYCKYLNIIYCFYMFYYIVVVVSCLYLSLYTLLHSISLGKFEEHHPGLYIRQLNDLVPPRFYRLFIGYTLTIKSSLAQTNSYHIKNDTCAWTDRLSPLKSLSSSYF